MDTKRITDIPGLMHLWKVDNLYLAGQPNDDSWEHIQQLGIKKVINLRGEGEQDFSTEKAMVADLGMEYSQVPIMGTAGLDLEACRSLNSMIDTDGTHFIHCGTANRVAGWLITYLTTKRGMSFDDAVAVAEENGLSNAGFIEQAEDIISKL